MKKKTENEDLERVRPRAMGKQELARLYGPGLADKSALNRLAEWMKHNPKLMGALEQTGYQRLQRVLTARQVALVFEFLGEP